MEQQIVEKDPMWQSVLWWSLIFFLWGMLFSAMFMARFAN